MKDTLTSSPEEENSPGEPKALSGEFLSTVSTGPGVYLMQGKTEVLYVGKARNLRRRLSQYARYSGPPHSKVAVMLTHVLRTKPS